MEKSVKKAAIDAVKPLYNGLPIIMGIILLISLVSTIVPKSIFIQFFSKNIIVDPIVAAAFGSILAGSPITSYILGGEFLVLGISLVAITAFLVSWVTVGIIQLPAEIMLLGKRFAITRNVLSFIFSIIVAIVVVLVLGVLR